MSDPTAAATIRTSKLAIRTSKGKEKAAEKRDCGKSSSVIVLNKESKRALIKKHKKAAILLEYDSYVPPPDLVRCMKKVIAMMEKEGNKSVGRWYKKKQGTHTAPLLVPPLPSSSLADAHRAIRLCQGASLRPARGTGTTRAALTQTVRAVGLMDAVRTHARHSHYIHVCCACVRVADDESSEFSSSTEDTYSIQSSDNEDDGDGDGDAGDESRSRSRSASSDADSDAGDYYGGFGGAAGVSGSYSDSDLSMSEDLARLRHRMSGTNEDEATLADVSYWNGPMPLTKHERRERDKRDKRRRRIRKARKVALTTALVAAVPVTIVTAPIWVPIGTTALPPTRLQMCCAA
jgi:hypothetical protein